MKSVVIIGGGLGGLFTGAILAKEGLRVTIVEKNATLGGGLQSFRRFGETFDTGMHIIAGMREGGNIRKICRYLGIADKADVMHVDDACTDDLYFAEDRKHYAVARGRDGFVESLARHFPHEREGLERYVDTIRELVGKVDLFNLRPAPAVITMFDETLVMPADDFIAQFVSDPKLRSILAYMNPLYGGKGGETPAYIHVIISYLYISGASRFVNGSCHFADLLADVIRENGGTIVTNDAVTHVAVADRMVQEITTAKGLRLTADHYISAIHPCTLFGIIDAKAFPAAYRHRLDSIPNSCSAFSLYVKLKPGTFPYINHSEFYMTRYDEIWNFHKPFAQWPRGFLFMTPPKTHHDRFASVALITAPMTFEEVRQWEATSVGHRGPDYEEWKQRHAEVLLDRIEELHPGFRQCVDRVVTASPLTIRDFYGSKEGCLCGFSKNAHDMMLSHVPVVTKVRNLLLTGQNNNLHGFCGVPLTAINTAEAILGMNYVINRINQCVG